MNILIVIVHYWDPNGGGSHQSLRSNPQPRIEALQQQLLCLRRIGYCQSVLHLANRAVYRTNDFYRNNITVKIVTDGEHHILNQLPDEFKRCFEQVVVKPKNPKLLGFEAHKVLAQEITSPYDVYGYLEDDLLIHDPSFFQKLCYFQNSLGSSSLLMPQRFEYTSLPNPVEKFFIDGELPESDLRTIVPHSGTVTAFQCLGFDVPFEAPLNPHSGCFFLSNEQLRYWMDQTFWLDYDVSFISPLESAATLGISKSFKLYKPCFSHASWFEIQHYGECFHSLITHSHD